MIAALQFVSINSRWPSKITGQVAKTGQITSRVSALYCQQELLFLVVAPLGVDDNTGYRL